MLFKNRILLFCLILSYSIHSQTYQIFTDKRVNKTMNSYLQKADSCKVIFDYDHSFKYIAEVIIYAKSIKNINAEILCNIKLVELYRHAALFKKSDIYLQRVEHLIKVNSGNVSKYNLMYYNNRKAALFSEYYHNPDSTLFYSKKALALSKELRDNPIEFTSLMEIGYAYEIKKNYLEAVEYYVKAYEISKAKRTESESCDALVNMSRIYEKMGEYKIALEKCNEGLAIMKKRDNLIQKLLLYDIRQNIYEKTGDKTLALNNVKERLKYTDLYHEKNAKDKLIEANKKYDILERERENEKRKKDIEEIKKNQLLLLSIILLFVLGLISLLYYSKKIRIANRQLDFYSKENAFLLNEANHRINNNLQLIIVLLNEELDKMEELETDNSAIKKILVKVESISTLHRHLYKATDKKSVDAKQYLIEIVANFSDIFIEKGIQVTYSIDKINVSIDLAMYLGLLATELFINSIKYAFDNQKNKEIELKVFQDQTLLHFDYTDNGEQSIGKEITPKLVTTICKQIKADYKIETLSGFEFYLTKKL